MWVRDKATMRDRPALASQADRVNNISFCGRINLVLVLSDQIAMARNRDIKRSSRHNKMDKK